LLIASLIEHAVSSHPEAQIVARTVDEPGHRTHYAEVCRRARWLANALATLGVTAGDEVGTLARKYIRHDRQSQGGAVLPPPNRESSALTADQCRMMARLTAACM
jgi:hypothetical protein